MPTLFLLFAMLLSWSALAEESETGEQTATELAVQVLNEGISSLDPVDILAWAEMPKSATVNEAVLLKITIDNGRSDRPFNLESIDLGGNFGKGFQIKAVRPKPTNLDSMLNTLFLEYSSSIAAGHRAVFEIELIAKKPGIYIGEVDIWEGEEFLTRMAQCTVTE